PERGEDAADVLRLLDEVGSPATVASAGGRYFGFVIGSSLPATVAASWLATAWDQNAGLVAASPVAAALEGVALRWLLDLLRLPPGSAGAFVTGATMANFTALAAARHAVLSRIGWDVEEDGLISAPKVRVIVGAEAHATLGKSLSMLGLGRKRVEVVETDRQGRMRASALPRIDGPTIICLQAGNVNSGAFDPAREIIERAHTAGAWVHVDGAFGLWASVAPGRAALVDGFGNADSWATDAHKWLNVPYDSGLAFVREPAALRAAMSQSAAYYIAGEQREPMYYTPETSRRARGVEVWAALRSLGRQGLADLVERTCQHAARFALGLREAGFEVLNDVVLNQVLVSFGSDELTRRVIAEVQRDGTCWCGGTVWRGRAAMRISVSSWATTAEDVEQSLEAIVRVARGVAS
ncbi:MAG: aspartate aminotransferase family protein, partial [Chloroflexi bacterium]|nr:aspartate aminotransferase family protein [Chloroflexota bacterium]